MEKKFQFELQVPHLSQQVWGLIVFFLYVMTARLCLNFTYDSDVVSPIWLPAGVAIGALSRFGVGLWPWVYLGAFVANLQTSASILTIVSISTGNTLEAICGAILIQYWSRWKSEFVLYGQALAFLMGSIVASTVGSLWGIASLIVVEHLPLSKVLTVWGTWLSGDLLGACLLVPIFMESFDLKWIGFNRKKINYGKIVGAVTFLFVVAGTLALFLFSKDRILLFLVFPLILMGAATYGKKGLYFSFFCTGLCLISATALKVGPFSQEQMNGSYWGCQLYLIGLFVTVAILASLMSHVSLRRPALLFMVGWTITCGLFFLSERWETENELKKFEAKVQRATSKIEGRISNIENVLRGGGSLFAVSDDVRKSSWEKYARMISVRDRYPGVLGIGVVFPVHHLDEKRAIQEFKKRGVDDFQISNLGLRSPFLTDDHEHYLITFIEPQELNRSSVGMDLATEWRRKQAAESSRDFNEFRLSAPLELDQDQSERKSQLAFVPIYRSESAPLTIEERRKNFRAWAFAPIVLDELFGHLLDGDQDQVYFKVYDVTDGPGPTEIASLITNEAASKSDLVTFHEFGKRKFRIEWHEEKFVAAKRGLVTSILGAVCILLTGFMSGAFVNFQILHSRANEIADDKTARLRILLRINETLNSRKDDSVILSEVLKIIRTELAWDFSAAWVWDATEEELKCVTTNFTPQKDLQAFNSMSQFLEFKSGEGLPGQAWLAKKPIWKKDITVENELVRRQAALNSGLRCAFAFPVTSKGSWSGVLEFFGSRQSNPDPELIRTMVQVGHRLGNYFDQIETEREVEIQKRKLLEASKLSALGEMSGGIAHEINNPLAIIQFKSSQLKKMVQGGTISREKIESGMDTIGLTVERIARIVRGLRTFARNAENDPPHVVPITQILENTVQLSRDRMQSLNIEFNATLGNEESIECREAQICQILVNLLNNSIDAVEGLEERWIRVETVDLGRDIEIRVTDSGRGIPSTIASKMMQPFFTTKEVGKGTGLGLSVSLGLAQANGGHLHYDSNSPFTCFVLRLPKTQRLEQALII